MGLFDLVREEQEAKKKAEESAKEDAKFEVERRKIEAILLKYGKKSKVLKMKNILFFMILLIKRLQFIRVEEFAIKALFILHPML